MFSLTAAVAGDVVRVEQLVVVEAAAAGVPPTTLSASGSERCAGLVVDRHGGVRDVVQEGMAGAQRRWPG